MIAVELNTLKDRAHKISTQVAKSSSVVATVKTGESTIGGGTTPGTTLPSCLLDVSVNGIKLDILERKLRESTPPVVARIDHDRLFIDLRTVSPSEDATLIRVLTELI